DRAARGGGRCGGAAARCWRDGVDRRGSGAWRARGRAPVTVRKEGEMGRRTILTVAAAVALLALAPSGAAAQETALAQLCAARTAAAGSEARRFCNLVAQAIEIAQP